MNNSNPDYIPLRINFIQEILSGNPLSSLVDLDATDTEAFINYDNNHKTQDVLKKEQLNFNAVINRIGGKLVYVNSGTTGHTFMGCDPNNLNAPGYAVKVVAYPIRVNYGDYDDIKRPENAELLMLKVLSYFVLNNETPHIVLPIGTFDTNIDTFIKIYKEGIVQNEKYKAFVEKYNKKELHNKVSILLSEWANGGDLLQYFRKYRDKIPLLTWKVVFFQILSVLAIIQNKYPAFRHNDMKANNILIQIIGKNDTDNNMKGFKYEINEGTYIVPNIGLQIKLWDFDFASIKDIVNNSKVNDDWTDKINVNNDKNQYYDIHYFFTTLTKRGFYPNFFKSSGVPLEVKKFIRRVVPKEYEPVYQKGKETFYDKTLKKKVEKDGIININPNVSKKCRLLVDIEHTTPLEILQTDPFFEEFRRK